MSQDARPGLLVHGGAWTWYEEDAQQAALAGVRRAAEKGWSMLQAGAPALDVVEQVTMVLEDDPVFDAGYGSFLNLQGEVEMDALITDGRHIDFGAVAAVKYVRNPIYLAKRVLRETENRFFVGNGAHLLALRLGIPHYPNLALVSPEQYAHYQRRLEQRDAEEQIEPAAATGTVGAVARDQNGDLASATSTGGTPDKPQGRVGDSPLFGSGGYSDNRYGAASATGHGEIIMRFLLSKYAVDRLDSVNHPQEAAEAAVQYLRDSVQAPEAGLILIDRQGRIGAAHTTPAMPVAWVDEQGAIQTALRAPFYEK